MINSDKFLKKKKISVVDFVIVLSVVISPVVGALSLIMVFFLTVYTLISCLKVKYFKGLTNFPFGLLGIIFISYFTYFFLNGIVFEDDMYQLKRGIQKIVPILIIGVLALTTQNHTFSLNHKFISTLSTWSLYVMVVLAVLIFTVNPQFMFMGHTLASKTQIFSRIEMGTQNALIFAIIITTLGFLSLLSFEQKTFFEKTTSLTILLICILITLFWNKSRGPFIVCLPLCIISIWYLWPNIINFYNQTNKKIFWMISALIIFLSIIFIYLYLNLILQNETLVYLTSGIKSIFSSNPSDSSMSLRSILWINSLEPLSLKPIFGYGISKKMDAVLPFIINSPRFYSLDSGSQHYILNFNHLHSIYFNHLISGGIFGFLILILYIFSVILVIKKANLETSRDSKYFITIVLTSLIFNGLTNVILMHELLSHFFSMLIFLSLICIKNNSEPMKASVI